MRGYPKGRLFFWCGLLAMAALYCIYYVYFLNGAFHGMALRPRHAIKFLFILVGYGIGVYTLRRNADGWMVQVWHFVYISSILLLLLLGIYDWSFARTSAQMRLIADDIQEFLVSPILYCTMGIIAKRLEKTKGPPG